MAQIILENDNTHLSKAPKAEQKAESKVLNEKGQFVPKKVTPTEVKPQKSYVKKGRSRTVGKL